jgi:hypothetical protein
MVEFVRTTQMPRVKKAAAKAAGAARQRVAVTFTLAPDLLKQIDAIAQRENRPRSRQIEVFLGESIQKYRPRVAA